MDAASSPLIFDLIEPTEIEGVPVPAGATIAIVPNQVTTQWLVDHPAPDDSTAAAWFVLSSPQRRSTTKRQIGEAIKELQLVADSEKRILTMARMKQHRSIHAAQKYFDQAPEHAAKYKEAVALRKTLAQTRMRLEMIHEDLRRKLA